VPDLEFELREIGEADQLRSLKLGDPALRPLKTFLQRDAKRYHATDLAKTYGIFIENAGRQKVIGYITLICADVATSDVQRPAEDDVDFRYPSFPAVKIARLAVHSDYQGKYRLGTMLVQFALGLVKNSICPHVGCRFVVVDAKRQSVSFYGRVGFTMLDTKENRDRPEPIMFVDMTKISA